MRIEARYVEGQEDRCPVLAAELVHFPVDVLVAVGTAPIQAAQHATSTIPIVIAWGTDPVAQGLVASLARLGQEAARPQSNAQEHIARCLVAYLIVERERLDRGLTWRQLKRQRILKGSQLTLPALERVRQAA